nr:PREDICTED: uncharacterized protein LOC106704378 [Latimeria chalumnae]|eukprot:XP_014346745.1 PREDICTED: uncharacterized protein LOC106704378 [Latimeria chalumnae]
MHRHRLKTLQGNKNKRTARKTARIFKSPTPGKTKEAHYQQKTSTTKTRPNLLSQSQNHSNSTTRHRPAESQMAPKTRPPLPAAEASTPGTQILFHTDRTIPQRPAMQGELAHGGNSFHTGEEKWENTDRGGAGGHHRVENCRNWREHQTTTMNGVR